jgi:putative ABC transport system ATP-binding protein
MVVGQNGKTADGRWPMAKDGKTVDGRWSMVDSQRRKYGRWSMAKTDLRTTYDQRLTTNSRDPRTENREPRTNMATALQPDPATTQHDVKELVISVADVHKYYDLGETKVHALRGVSLDIRRGEFVAIMGSSGSGKSTLMNLLGCLDVASSGRYSLNGTDVSELDKRALAAIRNRELGFVFQGFNLLARTTALENVELPTLYARLDKNERTARAERALKMVGLGDRTGHFPSQLSGGQQQRVAIARALVNQPSILLADEPTGNLDSRTSVEIMQIFQDLNEQGLTIVLVTHELDIANFAQRIVVFRDGKLRRDDAVQNRPRASDVLLKMPTLED